MTDTPYQWKPFIYGSRGLVARYAIDRAPEQTYVDLTNAELVEENAVSSRLGSVPLSTDASGNQLALTGSAGAVRTLAKLVNGQTGWRYAINGNTVYRAGPAQFGQYFQPGTYQAAVNSYQQVALPAGGSLVANAQDRVSTLVFRPNLSSVPYIFFAGTAGMYKDNGSFATLQQMGIFQPVQPPQVVPIPFAYKMIEPFFGATYQTSGNFTVQGNPAILFTYTIQSISGSTPGVATVTPVNAQNQVTMLGIQPGIVLQVFSGTISNMTNVETVVVTSTTETSFTATFSLPRSAGDTIRLLVVQVQFAQGSAGTGYIQLPFTTPLDTVGLAKSDKSTFSLFLGISDPTLVSEIRLMFDVGDGSFTEAYYWKAISTAPDTEASVRTVRDAILDLLQGTIGIKESIAFTQSQTQTATEASTPPPPQPSQTPSGTSFGGAGGGGTGGKILLVDPPRPIGAVGDTPTGLVLDDILFRKLRPAKIPPAQPQMPTRVTIPLAEFSTFGPAGLPGHTWHDVKAWRIQITLNGTLQNALTLTFNGLYLFGTGGPSSANGASKYDYRYTWWNANTGTESNPSVEMVPDAAVDVQNQPIQITIPAPTDPQVTHVRLYRRGGTLVSGWWLVAQMQIQTPNTVIQDNLSDDQIVSNPLLSFDNDVPVTSPLNVPVDTYLTTAVNSPGLATVTPASMQNIYPHQVITVDAGTLSQEDIVVISTTATTFTAYFQNAHNTGARLYATARQGTPVSVMALAFGRAWFAGDPNNPDLLYYSKVGNVEQVPPQNFIEVGNPNDPIVAIVEYLSQVFVFTQSTVWRIAGANVPSLLPSPVRTASQHGLAGRFAWTTAEGQLWFLSQDGVYLFNGNNSVYMSEPVEWVFRWFNFAATGEGIPPGYGQTSLPVSIPPADPAALGDAVMAFHQNEIYLSYKPISGSGRVRLIYHQVYRRWRADTTDAMAMLLEPDTQQLVYATSGGIVRLDRVGYADLANLSGTSVLPFTFSVQTPAFDEGLPKNPKVYQELTLDGVFPVSTSVNVYLDSGTNQQSVGLAFNTIRDQLLYTLNAGQGFLSRNISLGLRATVGANLVQPIRIYQAHYRYTLEAQLRTSFDTYWLRYGTDEWKFLKQIWIEYTAESALNMNIYTDGLGHPELVAYSFVLPASGPRRAVRVRLPPIKGKMFRIIGTSTGPFQIYGDSHVELKPVTAEKGYQRAKLQEQP
jgi:hypothetical protein